MATSESVITYFRGISGVSATDAPDALLAGWMSPVLVEHDPSKTVGTLLTTEIHAVALLLWRKFHLWRATQLAEAFPSSETGIGYADPSRSLSSHLEMAVQMRREYETYTTRLGLGVGTIHVSQSRIYDTAYGQIVPTDSARAPVPGTLSASVDGSDVTLSWVEHPNAEFDRYDLYYSTTAGLADTADLGSAGTKLGVVDTATSIISLGDRWRTIYKAAGMAAGTYYFVVVTVTINGRFAVSNEVTATVS